MKAGILGLLVHDPVEFPRDVLLLDCMALRAVRRIVQSLERILNPLAEILECHFHEFPGSPSIWHYLLKLLKLPGMYFGDVACHCRCSVD